MNGNRKVIYWPLERNTPFWLRMEQTFLGVKFPWITVHKAQKHWYMHVMRHGYRNENLPQGISTLQLLLVIIFRCKVSVLVVGMLELSPIWVTLDYWQFSHSLSSQLILSCNFQQTLHSERKTIKIHACHSYGLISKFLLCQLCQT